MCVVGVFSLSCVSFEQFAVAKSGIEKRNGGGDADARAQLDEAVVLEADGDYGVRDSTDAPPRSHLTLPCVCMCVCVLAEQYDFAALRCELWAIGAHRPVGGDGRSGGRTDLCE